MLDVTEDGMKVAEQLWHSKSARDEHDMAYLAAVSVLEEYPIMDAHDLANRLPFIHGFPAKQRAVKEWIENGWIERSSGRY